jgi:hypothetical protein
MDRRPPRLGFSRVSVICMPMGKWSEKPVWVDVDHPSERAPAAPLHWWPRRAGHGPRRGRCAPSAGPGRSSVGGRRHRRCGGQPPRGSWRRWLRCPWIVTRSGEQPGLLSLCRTLRSLPPPSRCGSCCSPPGRWPAPFDNTAHALAMVRPGCRAQPRRPVAQESSAAAPSSRRRWDLAMGLVRDHLR